MISVNKKLCCVNDLPGVGKVALAAMTPICSAKGINIHTLPTALVSNTLDYGAFEILDTTEYMEKTVEVWKHLGFTFDCISTGFLVNPRQVQIIRRLIQNQTDHPALVVVDPIMGDDGGLYPGVSEEQVYSMRELSACADILIPNYTEACLLSETNYHSDSMTYAQAEELVRRLRNLGARSVVITSVLVDEINCVLGYDHTLNHLFIIPYEMIDVRFPGTGDIFSAALIGEVLCGASLESAARYAAELTRDMIVRNMEKQDKLSGVEIEQYISEVLR